MPLAHWAGSELRTAEPHQTIAGEGEGYGLHSTPSQAERQAFMTHHVATITKFVLAFLVGLLACLVLLTVDVRTLGEATPTHRMTTDMMPGMQMRSP
jgi:hypothetical protein